MTWGILSTCSSCGPHLVSVAAREAVELALHLQDINLRCQHPHQPFWICKQAATSW